LALYRDSGQPAVDSPARIPAKLRDFAHRALQSALADPLALPCALGEYLTEPKPHVWFEATASACPLRHATLDRRTRMMFDDHHVFINGESYRASGRDARLMRRLADHRCLAKDDLARASEGALALLASWRDAGWLHEGGAAL
ncbi:MAG: winged helix domain-containing protein, partial [Rhodoferax sp.]